MYIVADERRHAEYDKKLCYTAFDKIRKDKRVKFLSYDKIEKLYKLEIEKKELDLIL